MDKLKQFAGQTVIYGLGHIAPRIIYYLLVVVVLTYLLGENTFEFGAYAWYYAFVAVFLILFSFRLDTALFRYGSEKGNLMPVFNTSLSIVGLIALSLIGLGFLFDDSIAAHSPFPDRPDYIRWFSLIIAFDIVSLVPYARLRLENKAKVFSICKILNVTISSVLIIFFLVLLPKLDPNGLSFIPKFPLRIDYVFISNIIASGTIFFILLFYIKGFRFRWDAPLVKKMLVYAFPLVIVGIANCFIQFFAVPLQEHFLGGESMDNLGDSGVYDTSRRIANLFALFATAFNYAAEPFFFNNAKEEDRQNLYGPICRIFVLVGGVIILLLHFGMDILQFMVDENYRESLYVIPILLMAYLFLGVYYNVSIWYKLSDKTHYGAYVSIIGVIITLLISIIYLPQVGYVASAWAAFATYLTMVIIVYILGQRIFPIRYPAKKIVLNLLIIGTLVIAGNFADSRLGGTASYAIKASLFVFYLTYMYLVEKDFWKSLTKRRT